MDLSMRTAGDATGCAGLRRRPGDGVPLTEAIRAFVITAIR
jgi:hypothetical protein